MRRPVVAISLVLASALVGCSADEAVTVDQLTLKEKLSGTFQQVGDKINTVLHRNQPEEEIIEVVEKDSSLKGRLQDGIAQGKERLQEGRERLSESFNKAQDSIKGRFQGQAEPEPAPVAQEEPTLKATINNIAHDLGESIQAFEDKVKHMFTKEEPAQEPITEEAPEKASMKERLQEGFNSASGKVKGIFNRESGDAEPAQDQASASESQDELSLKDKIVHKVMDVLHMEDRTMPPKVGEAVGKGRETLEHAKNAVEEGAEAIKSESLTQRAKHAYEAVREGIKGVGSAKDAVIDTNQVPVEGGKDAGKEGLKVALSKESLKGKYDEAKDFMKTEVQDSIRMVKEKLGKGETEAASEQPAEQNELSFAEKLVEALNNAAATLQRAMGMKKDDEKSTDL